MHLEKGANVMTRAEYENMVDKIVTSERDRLADSLNAVFEQNGRNPEALAQMIYKAVEIQPAVTAHVVTELLDGLGLLPPASEAAGGPA